MSEVIWNKCCGSGTFLLSDLDPSPEKEFHERPDPELNRSNIGNLAYCTVSLPDALFMQVRILEG
jgi:hypothetical protein